MTRCVDAFNEMADLMSFLEKAAERVVSYFGRCSPASPACGAGGGAAAMVVATRHSSPYSHCSMSCSVSPSADALVERIDRYIRQAAEAAELSARHEALYAVVQALNAEILELAANDPDDEVVMRCVRSTRPRWIRAIRFGMKPACPSSSIRCPTPATRPAARATTPPVRSGLTCKPVLHPRRGARCTAARSSAG